MTNDSDIDNDAALNTDPAATLQTLTVSAVQSTANTHGTVVLNANGTITYTPAANFNGPASFTYTLSDGNGGTSSATVNVLVHAVNDNPVAVDDAKGTNEDVALIFNASDLVANDSDVDNDPALNTDPARSEERRVGKDWKSTANTHGSVEHNANGTITYTPAANFNGPASFTYFLSSSRRRHTSSKRDWSSDVCSDDLVAVDDAKGTNEDVALIFNASDLVANDSDVDNDPALNTDPA